MSGLPSELDKECGALSFSGRERSLTTSLAVWIQYTNVTMQVLVSLGVMIVIVARFAMSATLTTTATCMNLLLSK